MRIAVSSQNFRTITGHAGRARRFIVFDAAGTAAPREIERLDLDLDMAIHGFDHRARHPLDSMNVLSTGGAGAGFVRHLAARGVAVVATSETDPRSAVEAFLAGRLTAANVGCNHDDSESSCACHG